MNQINQVNADGIQVVNVCRFANSVFDPCKTSPSDKAAPNTLGASSAADQPCIADR
jgi:hypothetical protein